ncbi:uncharacterized protein LOC130919960 [Corythoichthys intestinalis]|uniref:uncharacterized protein LOC130919960 n=1 Tax=Corythoichthys intestinalis TaxID=161448 RepID=UPI0025A57B9D|nr:uncharacterized protein LOC130919960 [Corythoichthys intestinalis]
MCALLGGEYKDMEIGQHEKRDHNRGRVRCLDAFMVASIVALFAALGVLAAVCVPPVMELQSKVNTGLQEYKVGTEEPSVPTQRQNFAYLEASSSELGNATFKWEPVYYSNRTTVGSNFLFDNDQHWLQPLRTGSYFIYLNLNLTCTYRCSSGLLSVRVGDILSCQVKLHAKSKQESKNCWTVHRLESEKQLLTQMSVDEGGLKDWKLELYGSNLGVFRVD